MVFSTPSQVGCAIRTKFLRCTLSFLSHLIHGQNMAKTKLRKRNNCVSQPNGQLWWKGEGAPKKLCSNKTPYSQQLCPKELQGTLVTVMPLPLTYALQKTYTIYTITKKLIVAPGLNLFTVIQVQVVGSFATKQKISSINMKICTSDCVVINIMYYRADIFQPLQAVRAECCNGYIPISQKFLDSLGKGS